MDRVLNTGCRVAPRFLQDTVAMGALGPRSPCLGLLGRGQEKPPLKIDLERVWQILMNIDNRLTHIDHILTNIN